MTIYFDKRAEEAQDAEAEEQKQKEESVKAAASSDCILCQTCSSYAIMELVDAYYLWSGYHWILQGIRFVYYCSHYHRQE